MFINNANKICRTCTCKHQNTQQNCPYLYQTSMLSISVDISVICVHTFFTQGETKKEADAVHAIFFSCVLTTVKVPSVPEKVRKSILMLFSPTPHWYKHRWGNVWAASARIKVAMSSCSFFQTTKHTWIDKVQLLRKFHRMVVNVYVSLW